MNFMNRIFSDEVKNFEGKEVFLEGWVHDVRVLGGINFLLLRDKNGIAQVTAPKAKVEKKVLDIYPKLRQEDVISVAGKVMKSKISKFGFEVIPDRIEILQKSEVPLPLDPREVTKTNLDTQLDWRVMYFRTDQGSSIFKIQSKILESFRKFLNSKGYLEIQPPVIISSASEGGAELFEFPYFEKKAYLAQSPQLYKQLCAISFEKVFSVVPVFRAERFDQPTHLNEIRQMDVEQAFCTDEDVMKVLEECLSFIVESVRKDCSEEMKKLNKQLTSIKLPLKRITYSQAVSDLKKSGEKIAWGDDFSKSQEGKIGQFVKENAFFIKDWPNKLKPFYAMPNEKDPKISKAFDLIFEGIEVSSGTQRIHIPDLLIKQIKEKGMIPEKFKFYVDSFRYGAPVHSGWSIGLERLTMSITGRKNIREVTMFPRDRNRITP